MASIKDLIINNPKIKRTTLTTAQSSTKILGNGELLAVISGDSFTLRMGDGVTQVKNLKDLGSGSSFLLTGTSADSKRNIYTTLTTSDASVEIDSQKFTLINAPTSLSITYKDLAVDGNAANEPYHAEINCVNNEEYTITFPTSTSISYLIRCNDSAVNISDNVVKVRGPKKLQLRYQNFVTELINATIQDILPNTDIYLTTLVNKNEASASVTLDSRNYTNITNNGNLSVSLSEESGKAKIFRGTIKLTGATTTATKTITFPTNTKILTNDSDFIITSNTIKINKDNELLFTIYDGICELFNPTFNHSIPVKTSQVSNDEGFIDVISQVETKDTSVPLHCDTLNELNLSADTTLTLSNTFKDGTIIESGKIPEYHAIIKLARGKTLTLPTNTLIKSNDETSVKIISNKITALKEVKIEINIRDEKCLMYIWDVVLATFTISVNITNGGYSGATSITEDGNAEGTIAMNSGYSLTSLTVTGCNYTYDNVTGKIAFFNPTSNITVAGGGAVSI